MGSHWAAAEMASQMLTARTLGMVGIGMSPGISQEAISTISITSAFLRPNGRL